MKTFTAVFLIAVIFRCNIGGDAFSFNLSGGFNPGISFGRPHRHLQRYQLNNERDDEFNWPQPEYVKNYDVTEYIYKPIVNGRGSEDNESPDTHHYESHHRHHRR